MAIKRSSLTQWVMWWEKPLKERLKSLAEINFTNIYPVHSPDVQSFTPAFLASHSFPYVMPSLPQTGK